MKANFGCGGRLEPGWVGVDIRPMQGRVHVCNFWEAPFTPDSLDKIYCRHALEHVTLSQSRLTLSKWEVWLKPAGTLELIVPCLEFHCRQLLGKVESGHRRGEFLHALAGFYGWQDGKDESIHRTGWNWPFLVDELKASGFTVVRRINSHPPSLHVFAQKEKKE